MGEGGSLEDAHAAMPGLSASKQTGVGAPARPPAAILPGTGLAEAYGSPLPAAQDSRAPPPVEGPVRAVDVRQLIGLLKSRRALSRLSLDTAASWFTGLVPAFDETFRDGERWTFEGANERGLVRAVALTFVPAADQSWTLASAAIRLHSDDPRRTFEEIRRVATATLKRPRWLDLGSGDRTGWSLGEGWELMAATLDDGNIQLRAGRSRGP